MLLPYPPPAEPTPTIPTLIIMGIVLIMFVWTLIHVCRRGGKETKRRERELDELRMKFKR